MRPSDRRNDAAYRDTSTGSASQRLSAHERESFAATSEEIPHPIVGETLPGRLGEDRRVVVVGWRFSDEAPWVVRSTGHGRS